MGAHFRDKNELSDKLDNKHGVIQDIRQYLNKTVEYFTDKNYQSSVTAAFVFYNPIVGAYEFVSGAINKMSHGARPKDAVITSLYEMFLTRGTTTIIQALSFKPVRQLRNYLAKRKDLNWYSPEWEKAKVAMQSMLIMQPPFYSLSLLAAQAIKGTMTLEQYFIKLVGVVTIGTLSAYHFNRFADMWGDRYFGIPSPLYDYDPKVNIVRATITGKGIKKKERDNRIIERNDRIVK